MNENFNKKKWGVILGVLLFLGVVLLGSYKFLAKFLEDRQSVTGFSKRSYRPRTIFSPEDGKPKVTRYNAEELEEARKQGKLPAGFIPPPTPPSTQPSDTVQRTLDTLEEINRINEMNRRLMEQQRNIP